MNENELDERKTKILNAIIRNYLETGEPVGSRTISKYTDLNLSSATIRNEMSDLEEMVPSECEIYLDRRLRLGETIEDVKKEMDALVKGKPAKWELGVLKETSWKGEELVYLPDRKSVV